MLSLPFSKCTGCGNDFIFIDGRSEGGFTPTPEWIQRVCHRHLGIGADGVIVLGPSSSCDVRMRIFNSDGGEAEMCGNAARCIVPFLEALGENNARYTVETCGGDIAVCRTGDNVAMNLPPPKDLRTHMELQTPQGVFTTHFVNTGVPHAVIFVNDTLIADFIEWAPLLRHHEALGPQGANVNIAQLTPSGLRYRTYERGVEAETLACGTGATAVALLAHLIHGSSSPVSIETSLGDIIVLNFDYSDGKFKDIVQTGPATHVFDGQLPLV